MKKVVHWVVLSVCFILLFISISMVFQYKKTINQLRHDNSELLRIVSTPLYELEYGRPRLTKVYKNDSRNIAQIERDLNDALTIVTDSNSVLLKNRYKEGYSYGLKVGKGQSISSSALWLQQMYLINKANQIGDTLNIPEYDFDIYTMKPFIKDIINLNSNLSTKEYLESILYNVYPRKRINIRGVALENELRVVEINLIDDTEDSKTWCQSFQGSSGGTATGYKLLMNILQPGLHIDWYDGVRFFQNDKPLQFLEHFAFMHEMIKRTELENKFNKILEHKY